MTVKVCGPFPLKQKRGQVAVILYLILGDMILLFVCVEVLWPSQPNGVMWSAVSLPNHTFTGQA